MLNRSARAGPGPRRYRKAIDRVSLRDAAVRRMALMRQRAPKGATRPHPRLLLGEVLERLRPRRGSLTLPQTQNPQVVVLLPGFCTHPLWMRRMARQLEAAGHIVTDWSLGFNLGPTPELFDVLTRQVCKLREDHGQRVTLVGWSLGGVFAREVAKRHPEDVAKVISMGSPFSGSPYGNNAWRLYELVTGHSVVEPPVVADLAAKPPVETVAFWSPIDGIVHHRCARGRPGERDRVVMLRCTHIGFAASDEAIHAVAAELERREK